MSQDFSCSYPYAVLNVFLLYRDRFRTMVNVMGDALATGIMAHICRKDFLKEGDGVSFISASSLQKKEKRTSFLCRTQQYDDDDETWATVTELYTSLVWSVRTDMTFTFTRVEPFYYHE